jgi:hypothetical protein
LYYSNLRHVIVYSTVVQEASGAATVLEKGGAKAGT